MNEGTKIKKIMRLTIVIPVYREHHRLAVALKKIKAVLADTTDVEVDVVYVDDGSPADSAVVIKALIAESEHPRMRLLRYEVNQGKGHAVKTGVMEANGDYILMSDADLSTPIEDWRRLFAAIEAGADIACGSRAVPGANVGLQPPIHRRFLSRIFNVLVRGAGVDGIRDTQCGFKLFRTHVAKRVFEKMQTRRFAFDVEMLALARDMGYQVAEVPVNWDYSGHSTVRLFSSGAGMLFDLFRLAFKRLFFGKFKTLEEKKRIRKKRDEVFVDCWCFGVPGCVRGRDGGNGENAAAGAGCRCRCGRRIVRSGGSRLQGF